MINVGAATIDITPPAGLAMAGFAARTDPAEGAQDILTARALVVEDTALVTVDVIGIDADLSRRARSLCSLPDDAITIAATHTHGGPVSMAGRLSAKADPAFLNHMETGIVQVIDNAALNRQPARVLGGTGAEPGFAKNRRQRVGSVDGGVPVLRFEDTNNGATIAILASYACHPVVLGPDNLAWTGDYPYFVRKELETVYPGVVAIFATGCSGDVNTGHTAASSLTTERRPDRSFSMAKTIGLGIAQSVAAARLTELSGGVGGAEAYGQLTFEQREGGSPDELAQEWRAEAEEAKSIHTIWAHWAETVMGKDIDPRPARCTALNWCGAQVVAMPGEIFAQTALDIRQDLKADAPLFVLAYCDDNPGYIPPRNAYAQGGYEVEEAHRFYGLGATVAPGTAERLADTGCKAAQKAGHLAAKFRSTTINAIEGSKS